MANYDLSTDIDTNIEDGPLCLPESLRLRFLEDCFDKVKSEDEEYDEQLENDLNKIKSIIKENPEYNENYTLPDGRKVKWNSLVLPILASVRRENEVVKNSLGYIECGDSDGDDRFPLNFKSTLLEMLQKGTVPSEMEDEYFEKFISNTRNCAPSLNGTACVGKSTILDSIASFIKENHNLEVPIYKVTKLGGWKYKDRNDMIGMQMPLVSVHAAESTPVAIFDRCPFNNLIWKLVMTLFECNSDEEMVDKLYEHLRKSINYYTIQYMKTFPIAVLIDTDYVANRERMQKRGITSLPEITGCLHRCLVKNYCKAQNVTYFAFALMCHWPCLNVGKSFPLSGHKLDRLMDAFAKKCTINNMECKPNASLAQIQRDEFDILNYNYAKRVRAFK